MNHICLCYSQKIHYIIIWHVLVSKLLNINMLPECNWRTSWSCWLKEYRNALGGHCSKNICVLPTTATQFGRGKPVAGSRDRGITEMVPAIGSIYWNILK